MLELLIIAAVLIVDLFSKHFTASWLPTLPGGRFPLIEGVFELSYVENRGAAFGMMQNARWFFIVMTVVAVVLLGWFTVKYRSRIHTRARIALALVIAGAVGNFIDRLFLGYVRDMFYIALINFAVFNVADAAITVGGIGLVVDCIFTKKGRVFIKTVDDILEKRPLRDDPDPSDDEAEPNNTEAAAQSEEEK